jgi:hypothetical protein
MSRETIDMIVCTGLFVAGLVIGYIAGKYT